MKRILIHLGLLAATLSVGAQYQLPNPGFEQWDGGTTSEPTHWNSFATSDGTFSGLASSPHHYRRNGGRPGSIGSHYLTIYTKSIIGIKANGNMTTGRIHAGSTSASSSDNYNYTQRSTANHCQPFAGTPDSMYVWVSYYAASASSQAQVSAIVHGDNDFRAPNQESNANLYCGKAQARFTRTTTSSSAMQWQQVKVPFVYDGRSEARYLLVNLTTNATPGSGSADDSLSIDDIEFVYSAWLTDILVDGRPIDGFRQGLLDYTVHVDDANMLSACTLEGIPEVSDATVSTTLQPVDDTSSLALLTVTAEDGTTERTYRLTLTTGHPAGASQLDIPVVRTSRTSFLIYPNPATDRLTVEADGEVHLTDLAGRLLQRRQVRGSATLNLADLPSGTYLLHCNSITHKVVKP